MAGKYLFASSEEFYQYIATLIERLNSAGETRWGTALRDVLVAGFTGHEVAGNLLLKLKELQASKVPARLGMQNEISNVMRDLKKVLRRW